MAKRRGIRWAGIAVGVWSFLSASAVTGQQAPTAAQWKEDLRFLASELPKRHPNLFHSLSAERLQAEVAALDSRIASMAPHEILVAFAKLTALVGETHTGIALHRQARPLLASLHAFPVRFHLFEDGLFIQAIDSGHRRLAGARVISIGGTPWREAFDSMTGVVQTDNEFGRRKFAPVYLSIAEGLHALRINSSLTSLTVEADIPGAGRAHATLMARPLPDLLGLLDPDSDPARAPGFVNMREGATEGGKRDPLWLQERGNRYWFRFLSETGTAYLKIDVMLDKPDESLSTYYRRVLLMMDSLPVQRVIVDLRQNVGGNNIALAFVEGLRARPMLNQPGKIFVVIGRATVSSGQNLATLLQRYTSAIFVGEPTGQRPNHYGVMSRFSLPNSRISVTHSRFLLVDSDPEDVRPWLSPDIGAPMRSADYAANRDPSYEAIMAYSPGANVPPLAEVLADAYLPAFALDSLLLKYHEVRPLFSSRRYFADGELVKLGHNLLRWGRAEHAAQVFDLAVQNDSLSYRAHAGLAEALRATRREDAAQQAQRRASELNPWLRTVPANATKP